MQEITNASLVAILSDSVYFLLFKMFVIFNVILRKASKTPPNIDQGEFVFSDNFNEPQIQIPL